MATPTQDGETRRAIAALVLPGGGAHGAYQVGVLKALAEFVPGDSNPFPVVTGISVGAINAASIASQACNFKRGVNLLARSWCQLNASDVYRTDMLAVASNGLRWLLSIMFGGLGGANPRSLLDNQPLIRLLKRTLRLSGIEDAIEAGELRAIGITASDYGRNKAVTFFQATEEVNEWARARRAGIRSKVAMDHLLASSSLPFLFPACRIGNEYFGDGSLRMTSPLSPAIHLGADRILVIGVRRTEPEDTHPTTQEVPYPSLGTLAGYMLDMLFMDSLATDIERLCRINELLSSLPADRQAQTGLRHIDILTIQPSEDLRKIAGQYAGDIPWAIRKLLSGVGAWDKEWRLASYLLFEKRFTRGLIALGYRDAMQRKAELISFLSSQNRLSLPLNEAH